METTVELVHKALEHIESKYALVKVAAIRTHALYRGDKPLINVKPNMHKNTVIALKEIAQGFWSIK
ncbi:hypothetical protein DESAMIL20_586 [Desulfurella amilsii]|uniref:DNA-directed RNA polymerase subunit omega n=1 Tax=Desulfurella amilsii TaxID=1562698 RepID=A0A1X4XYW9_9BACT|nr:DNA-directed RNA polymerase subunit omega [Desulfurella amilsii]OSS42703.1 hypothetical protein DESAMIL20_586 [Desulfurella amilsii]